MIMFDLSKPYTLQMNAAFDIEIRLADGTTKYVRVPPANPDLFDLLSVTFFDLQMQQGNVKAVGLIGPNTEYFYFVETPTREQMENDE